MKLLTEYSSAREFMDDLPTEKGYPSYNKGSGRVEFWIGEFLAGWISEVALVKSKNWIGDLLRLEQEIHRDWQPVDDSRMRYE